MNGVHSGAAGHGCLHSEQAAALSQADTQLQHDDLTCPVCRSLLRDPFVTACGHTFCYPCVSQHLAHRKNCPSCAAYLTFDLVYPNFLLQQLAAKVKVADRRRRASVAERIHQLLRDADAAAEADATAGVKSSASLSEEDLEGLLSVLYARKQALQQRSAQDNLQLLLHFLTYSREAKRQKLQELSQQLHVLENDIQLVQQRSDAVPEDSDELTEDLTLPPPAMLLQNRLRELSTPPSCSAPAVSAVASGLLPAPSPLPQPQPQPEPLLTQPVHATVPPLPSGGNEQHEWPAQLPDAPHEEHQMAASIPGDMVGGSDGSLGSPHAHDQAASGFVDSTVASEARSSGNLPQHVAGTATRQRRPRSTADDERDEIEALDRDRQDSGADLPSQPVQPLSHHASGAVMPAGTHAVSGPPAGSPLPAISTAPSAGAPAASLAAAAAASAATGGTAATSLQPLPAPVAVSVDAAEEAREKRRRRVAAQLKDLQQCYLALRSKQSALELDRLPSQLPTPGEPAAKRLKTEGVPAVTSGMEPEGLAEFSRMLSVFTHFGSLQVVAQVPRASARQSSAILSSIEFDRDATLFATAGVSKRISIFDFATVMRNPLETQHRPHAEISTRSKLSCLSWNKYLRPHIISSDYEGVVALWDVTTGQQLSEYEAHEKRIWTVDFCHSDPMHFVSGSDDGWVKIWSTKEQDSLAAIDMKANVCCVKYNPAQAHQIAIGSADHCVHVYDLRQTNTALHVMAGHSKAVAYVRFVDSGEVMSASTDSTLRLWDLPSQSCTRVYRGHMNEKNFVGMSVDGEFIACGSEQNEIYVYYKSMSRPIAQQDFSANPVCAGADAAPSTPDAAQFISSVCWKPRTNTLLTANSSGVVKVMTLTHD